MVPTSREIPPAKVPLGRNFGNLYGLSGGEGRPMHGLSGLEMGFGIYHLISNERFRRVFDNSFDHTTLPPFPSIDTSTGSGHAWEGEGEKINMVTTCPDTRGSASGHSPFGGVY